MHIPTGDDIAAARKRNGFTQRELAEKAGLSQPLIARIENEDVDSTLETLHKIAHVLADEPTEVSIETSLSTALPDEIRRKRTELGLTQAELAERVELSQPMIARIENGTVNPKASTARSLLSVLMNDNEPVVQSDGDDPSSSSTTDPDEERPMLDAIEVEFESLQRGGGDRSHP